MNDSTDAIVRYRVPWLILFLCAVAFVRVGVFSLAFPFFNNVDEQAHVDLALKYSQGHLPRGVEPYTAESANYFLLFGAPDYLRRPEEFPANQFPPPVWKWSDPDRENLLRAGLPWWQSRLNAESGEPPLYYFLAGATLRLAQACGLTGASCLYTVRFLNAFFAALLVWIGSVAARLIFPERRFIQIGVALMLAIWPQTTFYSIQSDQLTSFCFGVAFIGLLKFVGSDIPSWRVGVWSGLALAAACLVKTSSLPLLAIVVLVVALKARDKEAWPAAFGLIASVVLPLGSWFVWNHSTFGDLTATTQKIKVLGWTAKPISDWWSHPIFSLQGVKEFFPELLASFWRGEFLWHGERMTSPSFDIFYWASSALMVVVAVIGLIIGATHLTNLQRRSLTLALFSFLALIGFLVFLSISFDFGACVYPSRAHPYFTSGRLLCAATVPFFLLYVYAIDWIANLTKIVWLRWIVIGMVVTILLVSQWTINSPAFASRFNFYHLWTQ